jgi:hypothetical protein
VKFDDISNFSVFFRNLSVFHQLTHWARVSWCRVSAWLASLSWHWASGWCAFLWWTSDWDLDFPGVRNSSVLGNSLHGVNTLLNLNGLGGWDFDLFADGSGGRNWYHLFDLSLAGNFFHDGFSAWDFYALLDHFGGGDLFFHGDHFEAVNDFVDADHLFGWNFDGVRDLLVFGHCFGAVDHLLDFDGFGVWHFFLVFDGFGVWNANLFHHFSGGLDLFWDVLVVSLVEALLDHFGARNFFFNLLVFEAVDHLVNADHLLGWDFTGVRLHFVASDGLHHGAVWCTGWDWSASRGWSARHWLAWRTDWTA